MNRTDLERLHYDTVQSPLGPVYLVMLGTKLCAVEFDRPHMRHGHAPKLMLEEFANYFAGALREFTCQILLKEGTEFEQSVWLKLKDIPYGETRSYKWLAEQLGRPHGARAVGQALSKNPIPIVLPCHRVIESDGDLGGYSGGVELKRRLLAHEYYFTSTP